MVLYTYNELKNLLGKNDIRVKKARCKILIINGKSELINTNIEPFLNTSLPAFTINK